jgi:hypothetical protein
MYGEKPHFRRRFATVCVILAVGVRSTETMFGTIQTALDELLSALLF